jgi:hypothetical protein
VAGKLFALAVSLDSAQEMLMDWLLIILNNALVGVLVGFGGTFWLQKRAEKAAKAKDQERRRSLRALLRDEVTHNQEYLRDYQIYLKSPGPDADESSKRDLYKRLLDRPVQVWSSMWEGQAQHVGVVLDAGEIVPTARFHAALYALVGQWTAMHTFAQKREARMQPYHGVVQGMDTWGMTSVDAEYKSDMRDAYARFAEALQTFINMPNPIGPGD